MMERSSWSITWSVWRALFLREAMHRLFHRRAAWLWLLLEPIAHIIFMMFIFTVLRVRHVGGFETAVWIMVGLLAFYMFRRSMTMAMGGVGMAKPLFAYRQVKAVDAVLVRAASEGLLVLVISVVLLAAAAMVGLSVWPDHWLMVFGALGGLWLLGLGLGLMLSVPRELVSEVGDIVTMAMIPLFLFSGVIFPLARIPQPYRDWLLLNPIAHGVEAARLGFASHYNAFTELDFTYPYVFALVCILFGLMLHRIYQKKLIQK